VRPARRGGGEGGESGLAAAAAAATPNKERGGSFGRECTEDASVFVL
jgi:hypothetical protein